MNRFLSSVACEFYEDWKVATRHECFNDRVVVLIVTNSNDNDMSVNVERHSESPQMC